LDAATEKGIRQWNLEKALKTRFSESAMQAEGKVNARHKPVGSGNRRLRLLHRDVADTVMRWVNILPVDPDNRFIQAALTRVLSVSPKQLKVTSAGTFIYASLLLTEGTGLLLRRRWAEYFTIITTGGLVPVEVYEISRHVMAAKTVVLAVNVAIVVYLVVRVRRNT
jgi:uncharacterized membrane protein (DUF2068 family)